jgi:hypothetical protein
MSDAILAELLEIEGILLDDRLSDQDRTALRWRRCFCYPAQVGVPPGLTRFRSILLLLAKTRSGCPIPKSLVNAIEIRA